MENQICTNAKKTEQPHPTPATATRRGPLGPQLPSDSLEAAHCSLLAHSPLCPSSVSPSSKHLVTLSHLSSAAANARLADTSSTHLFYPSVGTYLGLVLAAFLLAQLSLQQKVHKWTSTWEGDVDLPSWKNINFRDSFLMGCPFLPLANKKSTEISPNP